jgi:hypothetical protein
MLKYNTPVLKLNFNVLFLNKIISDFRGERKQPHQESAITAGEVFDIPQC